MDVANAILSHLKEETPKRYNFKCTLSLSGDTAVIQTKDAIKDFDAVMNELTASYTLNSFAAVRIIQHNKSSLFRLGDISVPYMDLVFHPKEVIRTDPPVHSVQEKIHEETRDSTALPIETKALTVEQPENKMSVWLIISIMVNLVLLVLIVRQRK